MFTYLYIPFISFQWVIDTLLEFREYTYIFRTTIHKIHVIKIVELYFQINIEIN